MKTLIQLLVGLKRYTQEPQIRDGELIWVDGPQTSLDAEVLTSLDKPFQSNGGLKLLKGNLGRAVIKEIGRAHV